MNRRGDVNILFTSIGRRVELVRAFRRAYASLGLVGQIVGCDRNCLAPALQVVDRPYQLPSVADAHYPEALKEICRRERIHLVFPLIDPDVHVLSRHRAFLEEHGGRVVIVSEAAAKITADKWLTYEFFRRGGLGTPPSWLPEHLNNGSLPSFPLFIKPRNGSASHHAFKVNDARELKFFLSYVHDPIVQEFVQGTEISTDVICDPDGKLLGLVSRRRIEVRGGEVTKGVTIHDPRIVDACRKLVAALPAVGPITVQCMQQGDQLLFTEINARYGGGAPLGIAAGVDSPRWLLAWAAGLDVPIPSIGTYRTGLYLTRCDESFFLTDVAQEPAGNDPLLDGSARPAVIEMRRARQRTPSKVDRVGNVRPLPREDDPACYVHD